MMKDKLIELLKAMNATPEITCPRFNKQKCKGCQFDKGNACDIPAREANYLLANGISNNKFLVKIHYDLMYCYKEHINTCGYMGYTEDKFEFGKTAYHTKEEAEQALKGGAEQ